MANATGQLYHFHKLAPMHVCLAWRASPQVQSVYLPMSIRAKPGHPFIQSYHLFD